jgi:hypothetical protein
MRKQHAPQFLSIDFMRNVAFDNHVAGGDMVVTRRELAELDLKT